MKLKYIVILSFFFFWIAVVIIGSWLDQVVEAQEKGEYRGINLHPLGDTGGVSLLKDIDKEIFYYPIDSFSKFYQYPPVLTGDPVKLLTIEDLLGFFKEYKAYCDTVTMEVTQFYHATLHYSTGRIVYDSSKVKQKGTFMSLEGFTDWLENVKLKGVIYE